MALIKCPECSKEISDQTTSCPNCGHPLIKEACVENVSGAKSSSKGMLKWLIPVICAGAALIGIVAYFAFKPYTPTLDITDEAFSIAKSAVAAADDFLDGKLSASAVRDIMGDYYDRYNAEDGSGAGRFSISTDMLLISNKLLTSKSDYEAREEVLELRNSIAAHIGMKKR